MFGIDSGELLIIAVVALVVIGPKDLPRVMRTVGQFVGRARGMARHFRTGVDAMIRESELEDMDKKWKADNARIMREHPATPGDAAWAEPEAGDAEPVPKPKAARASPRASSRPKAPPARGNASAGSAAPPIPPSIPPRPAPAPEDDGG
jgi:sec-independent protein translocase protein TatB